MCVGVCVCVCVCVFSTKLDADHFDGAKVYVLFGFTSLCNSGCICVCMCEHEWSVKSVCVKFAYKCECFCVCMYVCMFAFVLHQA